MVVRFVLGRGVEGWGVGRTLVDSWPFPRVTRRRRQDWGRRRRVSTRFTIWILFPAISVNAFAFCLYRSILLVELEEFSLGNFNLFRWEGAFWLVVGFVRYWT